VIGNIVNGDGQGGIMPLYRHSQRVAYQHYANAFVGKQFCEAKIISRDGGEFLAAGLET